MTTIVDMPLNSLPPTVDVAALEVKRKAATGRVHVDVGFWGGAIPGNLPALRPLHEAGVFGFKCFTSPSGVFSMAAEQLYFFTNTRLVLVPGASNTSNWCSRSQLTASS